MKLAICAPFMESDLWQERLRRAAPRAALGDRRQNKRHV